MNDRLRVPWRSAYLPEEHEYRVHRQADGTGGPARTRIGTLDAMRSHWPIVLATVITLVSAGILVGLVRKPVYTAEGRLSVRVASPSPSLLPGAIGASSEFAAIYSRGIYAPSVIRQVAGRTSISPGEVVNRISATQVPDTGVIKVSATGDTERAAILLANQATDQLRRYVTLNLSGSSPQSHIVLRKYRQAAREYQDRLERVEELQNQVASSPASSLRVALRRAQVQAQVAAVERAGLAGAYQSGLQLYTAPLEVIDRATSASSDRVSRLQLFALIGLVAGLAVGAVLATVQINSGPRRRLA